MCFQQKELLMKKVEINNVHMVTNEINIHSKYNLLHVVFLDQ
jgi:hypothetical protein